MKSDKFKVDSYLLDLRFSFDFLILELRINMISPISFFKNSGESKSASNSFLSIKFSQY